MSLPSRLVLTLTVAALLPMAPAIAADYEPPIVVDEAQPEYMPVEVGSGWYLRGDVGYAISSNIGNYSYRTFSVPGPVYGTSDFLNERLKTDFSFGGGVGYRFNEWFRADATVDGFRAKFSANTASATPCLPTAPYAGTTCASDDSATMSAVSLMANGYVDLGTYVGLTPYVGAGAGYSYVSWSNLTNQSYCVGATCPATPIPVVQHGGEKDWRFTYALMAGVAYDVTSNMKLDVGYKYSHMNGGDMFRWDAGSAGAGATGIQGFDSDISKHEIKVGLRYEIW